MSNVIAEIRLAPGEVGYYDDYSRIYLNAARPTAQIYAGMNTTQIRKSIRSGRLRLVSGSLAPVKEEAKTEVKPTVEKAIEPEVPEIKNEPETENVLVENVETPVEEIIETKVEETPAEAPVEEAPAEEAVEEAPKRRRSRKKAE